MSGSRISLMDDPMPFNRKTACKTSCQKHKVKRGHVLHQQEASQTLDPTHTSNRPMPVQIEVKASTEKKATKKRPNYFVAVQITDEQIHSAVKLIQDHILLQNEKLTKIMVSNSTLHITLMVMHLEDTGDHSKAIKALTAVHQEYNSIISREPLKLEFCGVGHFQNKVLYAKLKRNQSYQLLCDLAKRVSAHLGMVGIFSTDRRKDFTPHLTIAKLDFSDKSLKKIKKIDPSWYEDFTDLYFGCDTVKSIQLLKMHGPKTSVGYYSGDELYFNSNDKILWKKLNALLAIADKKKEVRGKISEITKKLRK